MPSPLLTTLDPNATVNAVFDFMVDPQYAVIRHTIFSTLRDLGGFALGLFSARYGTPKLIEDVRKLLRPDPLGPTLRAQDVRIAALESDIDRLQRENARLQATNAAIADMHDNPGPAYPIPPAAD